ncbi:MAG: xanthine dehydrogenase molybdopterin binding subunit [Pseudomonadota bacterium]|nr:xanthine dehydrogenase molybdopterin binding subunit [Pseudomonadota bacterium]
MMDDSPSIIGAAHDNIQHDSSVKHVTGKALYVDDMPRLPNTLELVLVTSPYAHAKILSVDVTKAIASSGVLAVLTADDIIGNNNIAPVFDNEPAIADGVAEYVGHPIAIVAAETYDLAFQAAKLVEIGYEELEPVLTIKDALKQRSFTFNPPSVSRGDVDAALNDAVHRLQGELTCGGQDHFYLEANIALAVPGEDSDMTIFSSTQHPTEVQHGVSTVLGVPSNAVTVEVRRMGGGFGGKESQPTIIAALAAMVAANTGRPAKLRLRRDADMIITGKRHDYEFSYDVGFDSEGRIEGIEISMAMRSGNVADLSSGVLARSLCHGDNCYYLPNARLRGYPCKTNTVSNTAFRGFGGPQGMIVIETILEHIAFHLGMSLDEIRKINYYGINERNVTPYGQIIKDNIIEELSDRLMVEIDYEGRKKEIEEFNKKNNVLKKGIAAMPIKFGISFNMPALNQAGALVHVYTDGSVHLNHGGTEMGQGLFTKVAQVVATVFQVDIQNIKISSTRTDKVPNTSATAASAGSDLNGMAALHAADQIKERMVGVASRFFNVKENEIEFRQNRVFGGNESITFAELAQKTWEAREPLSATGFYQTPDISWDPVTCSGSPFYYFTYGFAISEVVIDTLTGESRTLRADILQDCGKSLNPRVDYGQIEGAYVQGMGWLTSEELVWNENGEILTHGPSTYKIPGSRDVPQEFNIHILEDAPNRMPTIYRSKAIGEPPLMLAISVWLALRDAVARSGDGTRRPNLNAPATPEAILKAVTEIRV